MDSPFAHSAPEAPVVAGLAEIAGRYDAFVLDLWGCVHDGLKPYAHALAALARLKAAGKRVALLSNVPRRTAPAAELLARMGIAPAHYDALLSSGEVAWQALAARSDPWHAALGRRCYHLGPERDRGLTEDNGLERVSEIEAADFLLVTGPSDDAFDVADHDPLLNAALARRLPFLCANPDLEVMRGDGRLICAGALALAYERRGGEVRQHGKPFPEVYFETLKLLGSPDPRRVLAVGDTLRTDIAGARGVGLDSALIPGGIHGPTLGIDMGGTPSPEALGPLYSEFGVFPTYILPELRW